MININALRKDELLSRLNYRCEHRHSGIDHPICYEKHFNTKPRVGYLDIETCSLFANFGIVLAYCIKEEGSNKIYGRHIKAKEMVEYLDKNILEDCIKDLENFDEIITYNGCRFDLPFLRTRALKMKVNFPKYMGLKHKDVYFMARGRLRLHRKNMDVVSQSLNITGKTHVNGDKWIDATIRHDEKCLREIFEHCKKDVIVLEKVYNELKDYVKETRRSI